MTSRPDRYDLIVVYTSFRRHDQYLNIAKALGRVLRIGILKLDIDTSKVEKAESRFLSECLAAGASLVEAPASCRALLVPRMGIGSVDKVERRIREGLRYEKLLILVNGPFSGIPFLEEIHRRFGPATILVQERSRFCEFEPETRAFLEKNPLEVVEIGSPFLRYPAVSGFETDYLVAYPSHNSLPLRAQTYPLLDRLMRELDALPQGARVMIKPHNVKDVGNYISYRSRTLSRLRLSPWLLKLPLILLRPALHLAPGGRPVYLRLPQRLSDMIRHLQNEYIFGRCESVLDRFPGYGLEHFISGVRKGVLSGLSTILWEALYQRKPVLCFDQLPLDGRISNFQILARSYKTETYEGFSENGFSTISDSCRAADLIVYLRRVCAQEEAAAQ